MVHSQCCHHRLKTMGTFILVDLSHHRKPKTISHPHTLLQIAFSCQTFEISLWIPLLPPLLTPTPEAFWLGPLEVTVICKISYILNLFWNVLFFSLYPLWWYVYSCLLPITVEFGEFFTYFGFESFVGYMFWKIFFCPWLISSSPQFKWIPINHFIFKWKDYFLMNILPQINRDPSTHY